MFKSHFSRSIYPRLWILVAVTATCLACRELAVSPGQVSPEQYISRVLRFLARSKPVSQLLREKDYSEPESASGYAKWYYTGSGQECPEAEGVYETRWRYDLSLLQKNSQFTDYSGTINFHRCPGGGRVKYTVVHMDYNQGPLFWFSAEKREGSGELGDSAPPIQVFIINVDKQTLEPDLSRSP